MMGSSPARIDSRFEALAWTLFALALVLSMTLSAPTLDAVGISYDAPGGSVVAKVHPGTYALVLAWLCALSRHGNPLAALLQSLRRQVALTAYLVCMVAVFVWVICLHGSSGAAYIVQTLWTPALALFTLSSLHPRRRAQTLMLVMGVLACNAAVALMEVALQQHLLPIPPPPGDTGIFRAWALLGHPLLNANVTIALLPAVLLLPWRLPLRLALGVLLLCSVLAFGARTALSVGVLVYGLHAVCQALLNTFRGRYSYLQLTGGSAALLLGIAALCGLVLATGLGERIFDNLRWDNSANVRLAVWHAFDYLHGADWWLGLPPVAIDRIAVAMGLDLRYEAIENFWIYAFLQFGAIGFLPFLVGLGLLVKWLLREARPPMRSGVLVFFVVASTANALSSKTVSLMLLAVVVAASAAPRTREAGRTLAASFTGPRRPGSAVRTRKVLQ